ncbi:zinc finger, CCHC-type containing protein [Tanacetum coccineum]|uniref:Zinc finger, CCHC-type containing protein n=1 Tax=Tanacetum coccineum TaxID=301880 RepID=A0ABQ5HPR4_9ASTR
MEQIRKMSKWENDDYACHDGMFDSLFDIYQNVESEKELWDSLEAKYMAKDALNFKHTLKHKKEELTLVELGSNLHIKESFRVQDCDKTKGNNVAGPSVVNMVEHNNSSRYIENRYGRPGHLKWDCKDVKVGNKANGLGINASVNGSSNSLKDLRFSHGKIVSLFNVLHVPNIRKNLVSSSVLNNCGYKQVIESDKFVLSKHDEALDKFKVFKTEVELKQRAMIKRFGTDTGGEYMDTMYFHSVGIIYETTAPYTLQQNGMFRTGISRI